MALSQIDSTLGAVLIGSLIGSILYGVVTVQLYIFSGRCQNDSRWLILFVYIIWIIETILTVLSICYVYDSVITNFGNPEHISSAPWTMDLFVTFQGLVSASVQSFFAYRVYRISNSLIFPCLIWFGSLVRVAMSTTITVLTIKGGNIVVFSEKYSPIITISFSVSVVLDILNVASLTWYLAPKGKSGLASTSRLVDHIILYSIETGLITSITGICMLATRLSMTGNFVWLGIFNFYAKLYSNTLLASLNARAGMRHRYMNDNSIPMTSTFRTSERPAPSGINFQISFADTEEPGQKRSNGTTETNGDDGRSISPSRPATIIEPVLLSSRSRSTISEFTQK